MSKNNRKRISRKITRDKKYFIISSDELKELIISAIKEERAKEDDPSLSLLSLVMQIFIVSFYIFFYFCFIIIIVEFCGAGTFSGDEVFQVIFYSGFALIMIVSGYNMVKSKSKNDISQHFTVLTTFIALFIAVFLR